MPEGETLPKGKTSKEWLNYADKKLGEFTKRHGERGAFGRMKNPGPLQDDYSRILSQNELNARAKGMKYLREEKAKGMNKGGEIRATGKRTLHKGEMVRKKMRTKSRSSGRK